MNLTLNYQNLGEIRIIGNQIEPLFCLNDICKVLEIQNSAHLKSAITREFEIPTLNVGVLNTPQGAREHTMINESQLYFVLMRSDKPNAKIFRQWIVNEVIPSIRKTGGYQMQVKDNQTKVIEAINSTNAVLKHIDKIKKAYQKQDKLEKQLEKQKRVTAELIEQFKLLDTAMNEAIQKDTTENNTEIKAPESSNNSIASKILNTFGGGK